MDDTVVESCQEFSAHNLTGVAAFHRAKHQSTVLTVVEVARDGDVVATSVLQQSDLCFELRLAGLRAK